MSSMSGPSSLNCIAEEHVFNFNTSTPVCLTRGQSIGLTLSAEAGFISFITVTGVLLLIFSRLFRRVKLINRPMDVYMIALFVFDIIFALGKVTHAKWIHDGVVVVGPYCTAQGVIQQTGETGVAMITIVIAIHTLIVVLWGKLKDRILLAYAVVACIWVFIIVFVSVTVSINTRGSQYYETPTPYWCWIGDHTRYEAEQILGEYLWLWLALVVSVLCYIPLFFWARGNLTVSKTHWYIIRFHHHKDTEGCDPDGRKRRSVGMIAYPLLYALLVLPTTLTRWIGGFHYPAKHVAPSWAVFLGDFLFASSGYLNVLLFLSTRSDLITIRHAPRTGRGRHHVVLAPGVTLSGSPDLSRFSNAGSYVSSSGGPEVHHREDQIKPVGFLSPSENDGGWSVPAIEHDANEEA